MNAFQKFYHRKLDEYFSFFIPAGSRVLEIKPGEKNPQTDEKFDYIIMPDSIGSIPDVQDAFSKIKKICHKRTKVIISYYNYLWEPILKFGELIGLKTKKPLENWLSTDDIANLMELSEIEPIKYERKILLPIGIPFLNFIFNKILANLPLINKLCLVNFIIARPKFNETKDYSVSVVIPAKNEKGNIENAVLRTPAFGKNQEFIFMEGGSHDGTFEEMIRIKNKYPDKNIKVKKQSGKGKGNAVREAFSLSGGEILIILDADLTTPPEDLPKFYKVLAENKGEFANGCRLIYPMEKQAMRLLNLAANKAFGLIFSFLLGQKMKDTLCGTKVLFKKDYEKIEKNRDYFGRLDPFGDFDLLFGASRLNLRIREVPVRYRDREYGSTQINRFSHGWLLVKMSFRAAKKIKFI